MMGWRRLVFLLLLLLTVGCGSQLPPDRPDDFRAGYDYDGGSLPYGEALSYSADGGRFRLFDHGVTVEILFQPDESQLDEIYAALRENSVDRIQSDAEEEVYDRGGVSLSVEAAGQEYDISDAQRSFVRERWSEEFRNSSAAIQSVLQPSGGAAGQLLTLEWTDGLSFSGIKISLETGGAFAGIGDVESDRGVIAIQVAGSNNIPITISQDSQDIELSQDLDLSEATVYLIDFDGSAFTLTPQE